MSPTPRTRGSLISSRASTSPSTARTSPATRSSRWLTRSLSGLPVLVGRLARLERVGVVEGLELPVDAQHLGLRADERQDLVERRLDEAAVVADQRQAEDGPL